MEEIEKTENINIVKKVCKELGLTYRELGEKIGYGEEAISKASRTGEISKTMQKAIELYLETLQLKKDLHTFNNLKDILNKITKP